MDDTEQNLIRYLLDELPEAERSSLEEAYFADPRLFDRIVEIENGLLDRYARGQLSGEISARFQKRYLNAPTRRERLEFAAALAARLDGKDARSSRVAPKPAAASWWQKVMVALGGLTPAVRYSLAFATLLAMGLGAWLLAGSWRRQRAEAQANAARQERERTEQIERNRDRAPVVAGGGQENLPLESPPAPQPTETPAPSPGSASTSPTLALTFGGVRGGGARVPSVTLAPGAKRIVLVLNLAANEYPSYIASLQTAAGTTVLGPTNLKPRPRARKAGLIFAVPATKLADGEYIVTISGVSPNGETDVLGRTSFRAVRK
jgi:hypothetical protein